MDIDIVITWVDGNDAKHKAKLNSHLDGKKRENISGAHSTRFASVNEIKYCVLSILKFAPFVRNIFIVTDAQNPNIDDDIKELFPERLDSIKIVDHKEIFEGYEDVLPTFNTRTITTFLWRIKGLSNNFVIFCDDFFLIKSVKPEDWFRNGRPVLRGKWKDKPFVVLLRKKLIKAYRGKILKLKNVNLKPTPKISQYWSAKKIGFKKRYFRVEHTPHPINKKTLESFFYENKGEFVDNIKYKFRHYKQFETVTLANHLEIASGNIQFEDTDEIYLKPVKKSRNYIENRLLLAETKPNVKFMCAQSLDMATNEDRKKIIQWLEDIIENKPN